MCSGCPKTYSSLEIEGFVRGHCAEYPIGQGYESLVLDRRKMSSLFKKALYYEVESPKTAAGEHSPIR
jgi:hypothetical protein